QRGLAEVGIAEGDAERRVQRADRNRLGGSHLVLELEPLAAGVVAAVGAHAVGLLRLLALRARAVRGRLGLPCGAALRGAGLALLLLGDGHRGSSWSERFSSGRRWSGGRSGARRARRTVGRS